MAAMNKKKGAGFYIGAVALILAVAGAAAVVFSSTISADYALANLCLLYTSPSPRDSIPSRMPSSA